MNPDILNYIQKLLKEEESINEQYFIGFNSSENTRKIIEDIEKENEEIHNKINEVDLNESAYTEDSYSDIEEFDFEYYIEHILENDYANYAYNVIEENFERLEELLDEYEMELSEKIIQEKERIQKNLKKDIDLNTISDEYYGIHQTLQEIEDTVNRASDEKDKLLEKIEELEEKEKEIEYYEETEDYDEDEKEESINIAKKEIEELENEIESYKSELKGYYSSIDWSLDSIKSILSKNTYVEKIIEKIEEYEDNIYNELIEKVTEKEHDFLYNHSKKFIESNNSIESFLKSKEDDTLLEHIVLSKNEEIQEMKIFKDKSIALKTKKGWESVIEGSYSYFRASMDFSKSLIKHKCRKKPKYQEMFLKAFIKDNNIENTLDTMDYFFKLEPVLKNREYDLNKFKNKNSEFIYDELMKVEKEHKIEQYAKKLLSNKYKHFITDKTLKMFEEIVDLNIPKSHVQDNIGKKLASYKSNEEFEEGLKKYINSINEFDKQSVKLKNENENTSIVLEEENMLIIKVNDYKASKKLGEGTSWCISRTESFFNSYVKSHNNSQYFIYDFTKNSKDRESRIGITIKPNGDHRAAHYKNDSFASIIEIKNIKQKILQNDKEIQKTLSKENKELFKVSNNIEINWANEKNSKRNYNYKSNELVIIEVKISDLMKNTFKSQQLDLESETGGGNAKLERIEGARKHILEGKPMDLPEVGCNDSGTAIGFTDGRHRTLVAYQLGHEFIPMFVEKENLEKFKEMVETKPYEENLSINKTKKYKHN